MTSYSGTGTPFLNSVDEHMREVIRGASVAFFLKLTAAGLGFGLNVVIARYLGATGAGLYFLALTVTSIAAVLGRAGLDNALVRFTAANAAIGDWGAVKGLYTRGLRLALATSGSVSLAMFVSSSWLAETVFSEPDLTSVMRWMALAVVPFALFTLHAHLLKGLKNIRDHILVLSICLPTISLIGMVVLVPYWYVRGAACAYTTASVITLIVGLWCWHRNTSQLRGVKGDFNTRELLRSSMPLFWMSVVQLVTLWSSTVILGMWANSSDVGIFGVASRTARLLSFLLVAVNSIAAPKFAALYARGDVMTLERIARNSASMVTVLAAPMFLLFMIMPRWIMGIFGLEFETGGLVLSILAVGQLVNVAAGSAGFVLMMCGYERLMRNTIAICAVISIVSNVLLIPRLGVVGAGLATVITLSSQNIIAAVFVWRRLGICTLPTFRRRTVKEVKVSVTNSSCWE